MLFCLKDYMSKLTAGIIVIGDEILSGRTQETNSNFIAKQLVQSGIMLVEIRIVEDNRDTIIQNILHFHKKYTYVFTTGGIGPTHDDITSESVSSAFNEKYCFHPQAFKILEKYYPKGEFNEGRQKMAKMPENAKLILNPLTAAPGFIIKNIYETLPTIKSEGVSILLVEQDINQALSVSDRVYCFQEGRVSLNGLPNTLSREQISAAYFGS